MQNLISFLRLFLVFMYEWIGSFIWYGRWIVVALFATFKEWTFWRCHDSQHNDIQYGDTQHYHVQHINELNLTLSIMVEHSYAECHLCWVSRKITLCWASYCWMSSCWVSLCWVPWRHSDNMRFLQCNEL